MPDTRATVLVDFDEAIEIEPGRPYHARVLGAETPLGQWEGWLEFLPVAPHANEASGAARYATGRETTQPNRTDLEYWSGGLTNVYLQGALQRAIDRAQPSPAPPPVRDPTVSPPSAPSTAPAVSLPVHGAPVLDPFAVFAQGEGILRQELRALSVSHLRTILEAYRLEEDGAAPSTGGPTRSDLANRIVAGVKRRVTA